MAMKTMLRQLISKWGIMSIDLQTAVTKDMAVIHEDGSAEYVENDMEDQPEVVAEQELKEAPKQTKEPDRTSEEPDGQMSMEEAFFAES